MSSPSSVPHDRLIFDPDRPFPLIARAKEAAGKDWAAMARVYAEADGWEMRYAVVWAISDMAGVERLLQPVVDAEPTSTLPGLLLGSRRIKLGWEARSARRATHVSREQFAEFHRQLRMAELLLIDVTAREPDNRCAWASRLMTARGLELGQSEAQRRYDRLARSDPHFFPAQELLLQQLCPKWGGSVSAMLDFARERAFSAPEGAHNGCLVPEAHLERWADLDKQQGLRYLSHPAVQQEVVRAAERSVLHPAYRPVPGWVTAHGYFALYHSLVGNSSAAAVHFRATGEIATTKPWASYVGDSETMFRRHRTSALKKG